MPAASAVYPVCRTKAMRDLRVICPPIVPNGRAGWPRRCLHLSHSIAHSLVGPPSAGGSCCRPAYGDPRSHKSACERMRAKQLADQRPTGSAPMCISTDDGGRFARCTTVPGCGHRAMLPWSWVVVGGVWWLPVVHRSSPAVAGDFSYRCGRTCAIHCCMTCCHCARGGPVQHMGYGAWSSVPRAATRQRRSVQAHRRSCPTGGRFQHACATGCAACGSAYRVADGADGPRCAPARQCRGTPGELAHSACAAHPW